MPRPRPNEPEKKLRFREDEDVRRETRQEIAAKLLALGADDALILDATSLTAEALDELRQKNA